jgi:acyl dehydratase
MTAPGRPASLEPIQGSARVGRQRLGRRGERTLALFPTLTMILVLSLVELLAHERILFAALAFGTFLIHLDPEQGEGQHASRPGGIASHRGDRDRHQLRLSR